MTFSMLGKEATSQFDILCNLFMIKFWGVLRGSPQCGLGRKLSRSTPTTTGREEERSWFGMGSLLSRAWRHLSLGSNEEADAEFHGTSEERE